MGSRRPKEELGILEKYIQIQDESPTDCIVGRRVQGRGVEREDVAFNG